jgi:hypothetical protein
MKSFHEFMAYRQETGMPLHLISNDEGFWQKLSQIANSVPHDLATFLDVPHDAVTRWHSIIQQAIKQSQERRAEEEKNDMVKTGD